MNKITAAVVFATVSSISSGVAGAADGCPPGTVSSTPSGGGAVSVFFDAFTVTAGSSSNCNLSVATEIMPAGTFMVYSADYRGFVSTAEGERGALAVSHDGIVDSKDYLGPFDGDLDFRHLQATDSGGLLTSNVELDLTQSADPSSGAALDSIDYALAATTTMGAVEASLGELSDAHTATVLHLQTLGNLLTGVNRPLESSDEVVLLGGVGSYFVGVSGRRGLSDGWSIQGGGALFDQDAGGADARGVLLSGSIRYIMPGSASVRPFAEGGLSASRMRLGFTRGYAAGPAGDVETTGRTDGTYAGIFARGGLLFDLNPDNQLTLSATLGHGQLNTDAYAEEFGRNNVFSARFGDSSTAFETARFGASWTAAITPAVDLTLNGSVGRIFASDAFDSNVAFVGNLSTKGGDDSFVDYGARLGFQPTKLISADVFVQGTTGSSSGTHAYLGGSLHRQF